MNVKLPALITNLYLQGGSVWDQATAKYVRHFQVNFELISKLSTPGSPI